MGLRSERLNAAVRARHRRPSRGVLPSPRLVRGERVLVCEASPDGGEVCVTTSALLIGHAELGDAWRRIEWTDVYSVRHRAGSPSVLILRMATEHGPSALVVPVDPRSRIPALAEELLATSTVLSRRLMLSSSSTVVVTARRCPGGASVAWKVEFSSPSDRDDPVLVAEARSLLRELRAQAGC